MTGRGFGCVLENEHVRLEPLTIRHASDLAAIVRADPAIWQWMTRPAPLSDDAMAEYIESLRSSADRSTYAVVHKASFSTVGVTSIYDYVPLQQRVEIGHTFYARDYWGGVVNPSCKLLLMRHGFEDLQVFRIALRTDVRNSRSASAIERLGATREGVLRGHRVSADGSRSDSVYFSVLAPEWPAVEQGLVDRLRDVA